MNMKKTVLAAAMCGVLAAMAARDPAGPYVWWHWLGSNVSEAGTTWANRMIGDELLAQDCEWGWIHSGKGDKGESACTGRGLSAIPDFAKGLAARTSGRATFSTWNYFTADSKPRPSGLIGPVSLEVVR